MNRKRTLVWGLHVLALSFSFAATWQMDSNQFTWSGVTAAQTIETVAQPALLCRTDAAKGLVTLHYNLSSVIKNAHLRIYTVNGVLMKQFDLNPGSNTIRWNIAHEQVTTGIYIACLQYGAIKKNLKISIVR